MLKNTIILALSLFFAVSVKAQTTFGTQSNALFPNVLNPVVVFSADLDGDGDMDILSASTYDEKIVWYENIDGAGNFSLHKVITTNVNTVRSVYAADLNGDGDLDVLSASEFDNKIAWYENTDGAGNFSAQKVITTNAANARSVYASDLDADGDMDVLVAAYSEDKIAWYENTDGTGTFSTQKVITTNAASALSVYSADVDGDGDLDLLSASGVDDKIAWYENLDGTGKFSAQQVITIDADGAKSVYAVDLDGDEDLDVLSASRSDNKIAWYENTDGEGSFSDQKVITTNTNDPQSVHAADLDGDGDIDVLSASRLDDKIAWYENTDGAGTFSPQQVISTNADGATSVFSADLDEDGDMDVLFASWEDNKVGWHKNTDGAGTFSEQQVISDYKKPITTNLVDAQSVYAADLDGDSDMDVLSASSGDDKIAWYENTDGIGTFSSQQIITTDATNAQSVHAVDLDGDDDMDVLSASSGDNKIAWYENTDGAGSFSSQQVITTNAANAQSVYAVDLDGDGDMDVLSASSGDDKIAWYENTDGAGSFSSQQVITTNVTNAQAVYAIDLDGDGDRDVLSASSGDDKIAWYENTDGAGTFSSQLVITSNAANAQSVHATDLDRDGDADVIATNLNSQFCWYENTDGSGSFSSPIIIDDNLWLGELVSVYASDMDDDGDQDVLAIGEQNVALNWYRNINGNAEFSEKETIELSYNLNSMFVVDLNGDGGVDMLSTSDEFIAWYPNQLSNLYPAPFNLTATVIENSDVQLEWDTPDYEVPPTGYAIYRNQNAIETCSITNYTDTTVLPEEATYYVTAFNDSLSQESLPSNDTTLLIQGQQVMIPDTSFRKVINEHLGYIYPETVNHNPNEGEMRSLEQLEGNNRNIEDLTGTEYLVNVEELSLKSNSISDITPLSDLTDLTRLYLSDNSISDLTPLADLTNLTWLELDLNSINDVTPLKDLEGLTYLDLFANSIQNLKPLESLTNYLRLYLGYNTVNDITPLSDLTGLAYLYLHSNAVSDIYPLVANEGVGDGFGDRLNITGNPLSKEALEEHIPQLEERTFQSFYFDDNYHPLAPCYPVPLRNQITLTDTLHWQANFDSVASVRYDVYLGESDSSMSLVAQGLTETLLPVELTLNQQYWWRVEAIHENDTLYGGQWRFINANLPIVEVEDWESNDFSSLDWHFAGTEHWVIDDANSYEGTSSARSGGIADNQSSRLMLNHHAITEDSIAFYYQVSSESNYDYLEFYIDGTKAGEWSGEITWTRVAYPVSSAAHTYMWSYVKDGSVSNGDDCAWVDYIEFPPYSPIFIDHQTTYQTGWNMTSFAVEPENNDLQAILQPLIDNGHVVKVIDEQGNIIEEMPWGWVNNIGAMSPTEGYYLKLSADDSITTTGAPVPLPYDIPLTSGWNMMGYPSMNPQDATEALAELMDNNVLIKVIDEQGNIIENMPWGWVNNIGSFQASEGYYIKVTEDATLTIEEPATRNGQLPASYKAPIANHFNPVYEGNPYEPMQVVIDATALNLQQDDELAIFSNGKCVGAAGYNPDRAYQYLTASKDDSQTAEQEGYLEGTPVILKVYRKDDNTVFNVPYEAIEGPLGYEPLQTKIVRATNLTTGMDDEQAQSVMLYQNKPNPFTDKTEISYALPSAGKVTLSIYDLHGQRQAIVINQTQQAGHHKKVFDASQLSPGVYIYKLSYQNQQTQHTEILLKKMTFLR